MIVRANFTPLQVLYIGICVLVKTASTVEKLNPGFKSHKKLNNLYL
jgi:hypothetical protein